MEEVRSYWQVAGITHFCSKFGKLFNLPAFEPEELEQAFILENSDLLVELAISLLKPHFNSKLTPLNWEDYLLRLVDSNWVDLEHYPSPFRVPIISQDGVELTKNITFNELSLSDKIDIFYALCDYRLWCEDASDALKDFSVEELRLESIGKDTQGYEYWYFSGTRLFKENKELSQDIVLRKKRIKELQYQLVELEKARIIKEQELKRKAELEKARQLAAEARNAAKRQKEEEEQQQQQQQQQTQVNGKKRKFSTPVAPLRSGLRERRSCATSNNNDSSPPTTRTPSQRSCKIQQQNRQAEQTSRSSAQKSTRGKNSKANDSNKDNHVPQLPAKDPEEECREELERLTFSNEDLSESWSVVCESLEEWENFAVKFEKTKSINEKYLSSYINEEILPKVRAIYAKRAAEVRRKEKEVLLSLASRRVSTRIITKRAQEEEDERRSQQLEAEVRRKRIEAEERLRSELEREMRERKIKMAEREVTPIESNGIPPESNTCSEDGEELTNGRYNLRQQHNQEVTSDKHEFDCDLDMLDAHEFDGIIHPAKLSEFYEAIELVIDTVRTSKHAWPFVDPVPDTVPGYYDLIEHPMDLKKLRTKIEFREYKSLIELEKDFQLIVNNCEKFNGPKNIYTKMVYKLWKCFRKNVKLYLQRDLSMDESETFIYPPPPPQNQVVQNHCPPVEAEMKEVKLELPSSPPLPPPAPPDGISEEIVTEEVIIDSYAVTCPDDNFFLWPQDTKTSVDSNPL